MSYLSRRCREIREEDEARTRRKNGTSVFVQVDIDYDWPAFMPKTMAMAHKDAEFRRWRDGVFAQYEETMRARNPINWRGRGG